MDLIHRIELLHGSFQWDATVAVVRHCLNALHPQLHFHCLSLTFHCRSTAFP